STTRYPITTASGSCSGRSPRATRPWAPRAPLDRARRRTSVRHLQRPRGEAVEEEAVLLEKVDDLDVERARQLFPGEQTRPVTGGEPRRQREAELVEQSGVHDLGVEGGATFEQHRAVAALEEVVERATRLHAGHPRNDDVGGGFAATSCARVR